MPRRAAGAEGGTPPRGRKAVDAFTAVRLLGYLSSLNLAAAVCVGMYARWEMTDEPVILVIFCMGLFVLGITSILHYYFGVEKASFGFFHLWFAFLLGLLCFVDGPMLDADVKEKVTDCLLLVSLGTRAIWALLERALGAARHKPRLLTSTELLELLGFGIASTAMPPDESVAIVGVVAALGVVVVNLRVKSALALPSLALFVAVAAAAFSQALGVWANPFALSCFVGRLLCEPVLDLYFSGLGPCERWLPVISPGRLWRTLSLVPLVLAEVVFFVMAAFKMADLDMWYLVIPAFCLGGLFWAACHVVLLITLWGFHSKLSQCQKAWHAMRSDSARLDRVMASRGIRHFCLISERLALFGVVSTVVLGAVAWQPTSGLFLSSLLLVLPLESLVHGLFHDLGSCLGGTCVGYALVIPTALCSADGQPGLLAPERAQESNLRSTGILSDVQRLFSHHTIQMFGCDYSTGGVTLESVQAKLRSFLDLRTAEGPRHDTYLVYYSGHTQRGTGAWALAGGECLQLAQLLECWREKNSDHSARLILVLDTENAAPWVKEVRRLEDVYVAAQGAQLLAGDSEAGGGPSLGDFTAEWVEFNCNPDSATCWSQKGRAVAAAYGVSKRWGDYALSLPTGSDVAKHWKTHFPEATYPMVHLANWCCGLSLFWPCGVWARCFRRLKLAWCPPNVLDTGQGIKLVHS